MIQKTNAAHLELHSYTSLQKNIQSFVSNDTGDCCCCAPQLDATSFENGYTTTEELVCSAVSEDRVCNSCATCISHTISQWNQQAECPFKPGTRNSIRKGAFAKTRDILHKVWDELDYRLDICHVTRGAHIESL
jgi:hypothetical protein